jgi:SagB-type dehydrogenase family enzyme
MRLSSDGKYVLSRFAYLRREGSEAVLESPMAHARVVMNDAKIAALVARLTLPGTVAELIKRSPDLSEDAVAGTLTLLLRAGVLQKANATGTSVEDDDPALQTWAFHDLLFHARSRKGRFDAPYGGTYRFQGRSQPPPALREPPIGEKHALHRPDLMRLLRVDPPLAQVQEQRRSLRAYNRDLPITEWQLGEFLFRVGRVCDYRELEVSTPGGKVKMDMASRPYPAGGGLYELELYVAVKACANLASALYHYDPVRHELTRLPGRAADVNMLLDDAGSSTGIPPDDLQVLIILAARVPRLAWKYESLAYALILKHVGVLYQTMYLAATAMGLAPCAVGGGDADLFARATGIDYVVETSVGEFLLGSKGPESADARH